MEAKKAIVEVEPKQATDQEIDSLFDMAIKMSHNERKYGKAFTGYLHKDDLAETLFDKEGIDLVSVDYWQNYTHPEYPRPYSKNKMPLEVIKPRLRISLFKCEYDSEGKETNVMAKYYTIIDNGEKTKKNSQRYLVLTQYAIPDVTGVTPKIKIEDSFDEHLTEQQVTQLLDLKDKIT